MVFLTIYQVQQGNTYILADQMIYYKKGDLWSSVHHSIELYGYQLLGG